MPATQAPPCRPSARLPSPFLPTTLFFFRGAEIQLKHPGPHSGDAPSVPALTQAAATLCDLAKARRACRTHGTRGTAAHPPATFCAAGAPTRTARRQPPPRAPPSTSLHSCPARAANLPLPRARRRTLPFFPPVSPPPPPFRSPPAAAALLRACSEGGAQERRCMTYLLTCNSRGQGGGPWAGLEQTVGRGAARSPRRRGKCVRAQRARTCFAPRGSCA